MIDHKVYPQFKLGQKTSRKEVIEAIRAAQFKGGNTATGRVLKYAREVVANETRANCRKAVFLFSDGGNNWGGDDNPEANMLKKIKNVEIYTVAFGVEENGINIDSLRNLASRPDYFFEVSTVENIREAFDKAFHVKVGKKSNLNTYRNLLV